MLNLWPLQHPSFDNDSWYIMHSHNHNLIKEKYNLIIYKAFLVNTYERENSAEM